MVDSVHSETSNLVSEIPHHVAVVLTRENPIPTLARGNPTLVAQSIANIAS